MGPQISEQLRPQCATPANDHSSDHPPYGYQTLRNGEDLRLLVILPGKEEDEVSCELYHTSFAAGPVYEALSYTWGTNLKTHVIRIGKEAQTVTENLSLALKALRYPDKKRTLWVDALCINQDDILERNQQV